MPYLWSRADEHPDDMMLALGRMAWSARELENLGQRICGYLVEVPMGEFIGKTMQRARDKADPTVPAERSLVDWIQKAFPVFEERNSIVHGQVVAMHWNDTWDEPFLMHRREDRKTGTIRANTYSLEAGEFDRVRLMCEELSEEATRVDVSLASRGQGL